MEKDEGNGGVDDVLDQALDDEINNPDEPDPVAVEGDTDLKDDVPGLVKAKMHEKKRRQAVETELAYYKGLHDQQQQKGNKQPEQEMEDDEYLTFGQFKKLYTKQAEEEQQRTQDRRMKKSVTVARKMCDDEGLDYDQILAWADEQINDDPVVRNMIMSSDSPAVEALKVAKYHPEYLKKKEGAKTKKVAKDVVDKIAKNSSKPQTLSNAGGGGSNVSKISEIKNMSDAEFLKYVNNIR